MSCLSISEGSEHHEPARASQEKMSQLIAKCWGAWKPQRPALTTIFKTLHGGEAPTAHERHFARE